MSVTLTDEQASAAAFCVAHMIDKHGYSSIVDRAGLRVRLDALLTTLTDSETGDVNDSR